MTFRLTENHFDVDEVHTRYLYTKMWQYIHPETLDYFIIKAHDKALDCFSFEVQEKTKSGLYIKTHDGATNRLDIAISIMNGWKFEE